jgi:hypothetical protein
MTNTAHVSPDPRPGDRVTVTRPGPWHGTSGIVTLAVLSWHTDLWVHVVDTCAGSVFYADELESDQP